ncbi:MAG: helix-turn-helix domain-containing protein [Planctomycetota bacterium]
MTESWYSLDGGATHLGIARRTLFRWIDQKGSPAQPIGEVWKVTVTEVDEWAGRGQI